MSTLSRGVWISLISGILLLLPLLIHTDSAQAVPILYASLDESDSGGNTLVTINVISGLVDRVGPLGEIIIDMAYDPHTDTLYGLSGSDGGGTDALYRIDRVTGAASIIGPLGVAYGWGLAYNSISQRLLATTIRADADPSLYEVDVTTGVASRIGSLGVPSSSVARGLTFAPMPGALYLIVEGPEGGLYRVDEATGGASVIGFSNPLICCNEIVLEYDPLGDRLLAIDSPGAPDAMFVVDSETGAASLLTVLTVSGRPSFRGAAFAEGEGPTNKVPEPSTFTLLVVGLVALVTLRQHRRDSFGTDTK